MAPSERYAPPTKAEQRMKADAKVLEAFRRRVDAVVRDVAREAPRIHPDLLRMPLVAMALADAAMHAVGAQALRDFLTYCVRAGLQPGKDVDARIIEHPETHVLSLQPEIVFRSLEQAEEVTMPGDASAFDGFGGHPIGLAPDAILRGVLFWIELRPNRPTTYARLVAAIHRVLEARRAAAAATQPEATPA